MTETPKTEPTLLNWPPSRGPMPDWMEKGPVIEVPKITLLTSERAPRSDSERAMIAESVETIQEAIATGVPQDGVKTFTLGDVRKKRDEQQKWDLSMSHHLASIAPLDVRIAERLVSGVSHNGRLSFQTALPERTYRVVLDYPLSVDVVLSIPPLIITSRKRPGREERPPRLHQTVGYLAWVIAKTYQDTIYADWERFGVWGHAITDLWFERMRIDGEKLEVELGS